MKKAIILLITTAIVLFSFASCMENQSDGMTDREREIAERTIVRNIGITKGNNLGRAIADINNIEATTEISTQIVLCHVDRLEKVFITELNVLHFIYEITIEDIYMDVNNMLKIGDTAILSTAKGIMKGNEFAELVKNSAHAQKFGYANQKHRDNEYIASSSYDGIPVEVGKKYIIYLTDEYFESDNLYAEIGGEFLYEYTDGVLYQSLDYQKMDVDIAQLKEQISIDIANRTGRCDEVGFSSYIRELGKIQRASQTD